jgi:hypothetical protein
MGFEPKNSHPIRFKCCGPESQLSITTARLLVAELQVKIANAEVVEANEYLSYRLKLHNEEISKLHAELNFYKSEEIKKRKKRKS